MSLARKLTSLAGAGLIATAANAAISISLDIEALKGGAGQQTTSGGVLALVVSTADSNFSQPTNGSIVSGDDEVVALFDLSGQNLPDDDFALIAKSIAYGGNWAAGKPLGVYWFPGMTKANPVPTTGQKFGFYSHKSGTVPGDAWVLPANGSLLTSLKLFTSDTNELASSGTVPADVTNALFAVGTAVQSVQSPSGIMTGANSSSSATISWQAGAASGGGYLIERRLSGSGSYAVVGVVGSSATSYVDTTVSGNKTYDYRVTSMNGYAVASSSSSVLSTPAPSRSALVALSIRGQFSTNPSPEVMIGGLAVKGTGQATVLMRAVGPSMVPPADLAGQNAQDPTASFFLNGQPWVTVDDWEDIDGPLVSQIGADLSLNPVFSSGSKDVGLVSLLGPGLHAFIASDKLSGNNVGLVEMYDAYQGDVDGAPNSLQGVSTRAFVGVGGRILIGAFVVKGEVSMPVLVRGLGPNMIKADPSLAGSLLLDPEIQVIKLIGSQDINQTNDDWEVGNDASKIAAIAEAVARNGSPVMDSGSKDAAMLLDLQAGTYAVILRGKNETTGVGQVEIYDMQED